MVIYKCLYIVASPKRIYVNIKTYCINKQVLLLQITTLKKLALIRLKQLIMDTPYGVTVSFVSDGLS